MLMGRNYGQLLRIWESNYGRDAGWTAERDGKPVCTLSEYGWEDMFWDSYRVEVIAEDPEVRSEMLASDYWRGDGWTKLTWRNREFRDVSVNPYTFPAAGGMTHDGRVAMRSLYLAVRTPWPWDWLVLWYRGKSKIKQTNSS